MENVKTKWCYEKLALKKPVLTLCFVVLTACLVSKLFFCTVSLDGSGVYSNMTSDYWNFGKDILNGKELYKDLVDHKGAYLYFIYAFMVFVSSNNVWVVALFETLLYALTVGAFYWYMKDVEISSQSDRNKVIALFPTSIFAFVYLLSTSNVTLVNTEGVSSLCFILIWGTLKRHSKVTPRMFFAIGIALGVLFNFKITSIAPYTPLFLYGCAKHMQSTKEFKELLKAIGLGIFGFVAINIPFFAYVFANDSWGTFVEIYRYACEETGEDLVKSTIIWLMVSASGILFIISGNKKVGTLVVCLSSLGLNWVFGNNINYYIAFYIVIVFLELFPFRSTNKLIALLLVAIMVLYGAKEVNVNFNQKETVFTKEIAMKYGITNENILYLWEDLGYGVYSDKSFIEPYQWVPARFFCSKEFTDYYTKLTIERLESKQFEYVYAPPLDMIKKIKEVGNMFGYESSEIDKIKVYKKNMSLMYLEIASYLEENYDDSLVEGGYLYKAK